MGNKITLTYENGEFNVAINERVIYSDKDMENSLLKFNSVVKNNAIEQSNSWEAIENKVVGYDIEGVQINPEFKTINFGKMKYFYSTDKVFYMDNSGMVSLGGGYSLFDFVLDKISTNKLTNEENFLELCKISMINKAIFSAHEDVILISSPKFSYGTVGYNFSTGKINKGTSSEKASFDEFKKYVLDILK